MIIKGFYKSSFLSKKMVHPTTSNIRRGLSNKTWFV